ncbi:MAG: helix-turn-helix transcriptional regulator [Clostridia bacterium]|nr:helix-turn-helix transcriptional regulator [Clostridia bacterium]
MIGDWNFSTILNKHESDDNKQANEESLIIAAIKDEFFNSKEILDTANSLSISARDFMLGRITEFPIIPIRQSNEFYVKKHTQSQTPYFHCHKFYELIYVHRGKSWQQFKDGSKLCLTEKQCLLIYPNAVHLIEKIKRSDIILKIVIPCDLFDLTGGEILSALPCNEKILFENVSETAEFAILKLLAEQSCKSQFKDLVIRSFLNIIFVELLNSKKNNIALETLLNSYFEDNIKTASLSEFAAIQNYNANYISRLIKSQTGKSFSDLLSSYRVNRAKRLLIESELTVEDIAAESGYSNASGLYKQFFSLLGMKPSEYRNLFK